MTPEPIVLDWRHCPISTTFRPCVLCGQPTILLSPRGKPCHKTCAETWLTHHHRVTTRDDLLGGAA